MKLFKILSAILALILLLGSAAPAAHALTAPELPAEAVIMVDMDSGNILYEKNMYQRRSPASLTKIVTCLLAVEAIEAGEISADELITAGEDCRRGLDEESSSVGIVPGEEMAFADLIRCSLITSANEACNIIATAVSGSIDAFILKMNERAKALGCTDSNFTDTNGLSSENHYTTAYDLYLITIEALKHPLFAEICNTRLAEIPPTNMYVSRIIHNSNALISPGSIYGGDYVYQYACGVKTGYTYAAGYCLVSTAKKGEEEILCIVLGCDGPNNKGIEQYTNFDNSITLYNWAFENFEYRNIISAEEPIQTVSVSLAEGNDQLLLYPEKDVRLLLPADIGDDQIVRSVTTYHDKLVAPIRRGTALGHVDVYVGDIREPLVSVRLQCRAEVELSKTEFFKARVYEYLEKLWVKLIILIVLALVFIYISLFFRYRKMRRKHTHERKLAEEKRAEEFARRHRSVSDTTKKFPKLKIEKGLSGSEELDEILENLAREEALAEDEEE